MAAAAPGFRPIALTERTEPRRAAFAPPPTPSALPNLGTVPEPSPSPSLARPATASSANATAAAPAAPAAPARAVRRRLRPRRAPRHDPEEASVGVAAICWPLGQPLASSDPNCRRQRFAWTLDGTTPPTLLAQDQPLGLGLQEHFWVNPAGLRVDSRCPGATAQKLALWPAPLEPWLPRRERRSARLPAADPQCPPPQVAVAAPLSIVGVREGDRLRRPAGHAEPLRLRLSALGGSGRRWWFVDGQPVAETRSGAPFNQLFARSGQYQLSVLDESGQTAQVQFSLSE